MQCKRCGANIVPLTIYVEADVAAEAEKTGEPPYIITTNQPMPNPSYTSTINAYLGWSWPCHHEPEGTTHG